MLLPLLVIAAHFGAAEPETAPVEAPSPVEGLAPLEPESPAPPSTAPASTAAPAPATTTSPAGAPEPAPSAAAGPAVDDVKKDSGTLGGLLGASSGCAAGFGIPALTLGAGGGGLLYYLYSGASAGTIVGWTPALVAGSTATSMCGGAVCLPMISAGATAAGAVYGVRQDGRDPGPAMLGALPGLGLGALSTAIGLAAVGVACVGSIGAIQPVVIMALIAAVIGVGAAPCTACGAGVADLVWGNAAKVTHEEPLAGTGSAPMKF